MNSNERPLAPPTIKLPARHGRLAAVSTRLARRPGLIGLLILLCSSAVPGWSVVRAADIYDAAVAHAGRTEADRKRDELDHPAEILRLAGIKPGMKVADVLAGDGYYSELLSYVVGPKGHVLLINNAPFEKWSEEAWRPRLADNRLPNVEHRTVDINHPELGTESLDAIFLIKVYHDLYWVDTRHETPWPEVETTQVLDQLVHALKHGGKLVIVDHSAEPGTGTSVAGSLHRIEESYTRKDLESRGLKVVANSDVLRRKEDARDQISYKGPMLGKTDRFVLVFRKA
ncbi:MAG: class I SAM-dependent methyltransferase [Sinobacteraceae bacterium]|nr:class I SAM-dependent methyltransferase [Nevskiaceae bacterium]